MAPLGAKVPLFAIDQRPAKRAPMHFDTQKAFTMSDADRQTIEAIGGDVDELFDRAMAQKAKGRRIDNLVRYMVAAAKNDTRERLGLPLGVVTEIASGNQHQRRAAFAALEQSSATEKLARLHKAPTPAPSTQLARMFRRKRG